MTDILDLIIEDRYFEPARGGFDHYLFPRSKYKYVYAINKADKPLQLVMRLKTGEIHTVIGEDNIRSFFKTISS